MTNNMNTKIIGSKDTPRIVGTIYDKEAVVPEFFVEITKMGPRGRSIEFDVDEINYKIGVRLEGESEFQYVEFDEAKRISNESARVTAENLRAEAEIDRDTAEGLRDTAEGLRDSAETARDTAEGLRDDAETLRQTEYVKMDGRITTIETTEEDREAAEGVRASAEIARNTAEGLRDSAETARNTAEGIREENEGDRKAAELLRKSAESDRETAYGLAEEARDGLYETAEGDRDSAYGLAENARDSLYSTAEGSRNTDYGLAETARDSSYTSAEELRTTAFNTAQSDRATAFSTAESARTTTFNTAENTRNSNEVTRIANENARIVYEDYNPAKDYVVGNKVAYQGSSYRNKAPCKGIVPTNTTYWLLIAAKGDTGEQGIQGLKGDKGDTGIQGIQGPKGDDGLTTAVKVGSVQYNHTGGVVSLPAYPTALPADGGDADTVNGKTVGTNVPADAKFTDTVYTHPASHPASMITDLPTGKKVARFVVGTSTAGWTAADCDYLCDGTADQTEINAAITALPATGGEIVILDGTYSITATIDVTKDNVSIRGNGDATILKRMFDSSVVEGVITLNSRSGCKIADLQVDGNSASFANIGNSGIYLGVSSNNTVTGNTCNNNSYGIYLISSSNNTFTGNTCNNNNYGIYLVYSSNNNTVTGNTCTRGTGLPTDYTASQYTIWLSGIGNNYNLISNNNCMGKAPVVNGGTGNSVYGNKYDSGDYKDFTQDEKTKLAGISDEANNYTHPDSHPASMITGLPNSLPADGGNADTVGGFTVGVNVPANAKFTDTITSVNGKTGTIAKADIVALGIPSQDTNTTYSEITTAEIDNGTASTLRAITGRRVKYILDKVQGWIGGLTKSDVGLGNVDNIKQASKTDFDAHHSDTTKHILSTERTNWNAKETTTGSQNKANQAEQNAKDYTDGKVLTDVPLNAKFTDTVYTHPATHSADMITGLPTSLPASGGNADTVGGFTVGVSVPANAKFTDTVYSHPTTHPASMITESSTKRFVSDTKISEWDGKETTTGSQDKANQAEQNAKDYTDQEISSIDIPDSTWESIQNKPDTFAPSEHVHSIGSVTDLQNELNSKETPSGAQSKANVAESNAKDYVDDKVKTDVPVGAKFTDTVYTHPPTHPASMITDLPTGKKVARFVVGTSTAGWTAADCDYLCDGTADQTEINAAITALPATGGEIVILDGTYNITAKIDVTKDNVSIRGNGNATILKRMFNSASAEGVITLTGRSGCKIANLQIDGNRTSYNANNNYAINLDSSSNNIVTSNTCNNNSCGIYINASSNNTVTGSTCNNNNYGIYIRSSSNNNTVTSNTCYNSNNSGIYINASSNNTVTGSTCNNNNYGIYIRSSSNNNTVTSNTCYNSNNSGICLSYSSRNTVTGNTCNSNNDGIYLATLSNSNTVTGNICNDNIYGIYLFDSSNSNTVTGNTCTRGTGLETDYTAGQYTIWLSGADNNYNLISNNNCMGKAPRVDDGTGNSVYGNKYDSGDYKDFTQDEKTKLAGISDEANKYTHPTTHPASMITGLPTSLPADGGNADTVGGFTVGVNVPAGAEFTDTITLINGKAGVISKDDIVALGIPSQDTTYSEITTAEIDAGTASTLRTITGRRVKYILDKVQGWIGGLTKSDVGLSNVTNDKQMPISGGILENYREKLVTLSGTSTTINLNNGNVFTHTLSGDTVYSISNAQSQAHSFTLIITQTETVRTLTFPASVKWQGGEIPDLSGASKTYVLTFLSIDGGTTWLGMFGGEF